MKWWKENWWKIIGIIFIWLGGYFFGYTPKKCPTCPPVTERVYIGYQIGENDTLNIVIDSIRIINVIDVR